MSESRPSYMTSSAPISNIEYINDEPNMLEYLKNLRRDFLRKVRDIDELIAQMQHVKPSA